jgi:hypothetical protein
VFAAQLAVEVFQTQLLSSPSMLGKLFVTAEEVAICSEFEFNLKLGRRILEQLLNSPLAWLDQDELLGAMLLHHGLQLTREFAAVAAIVELAIVNPETAPL